MSAADLVRFTIQTVSGLVDDAIVIADSDLYVLDANAAFQALTGLSSLALIGRRLGTLTSEPDRFDDAVELRVVTPGQAPAEQDPVDIDLVHASGDRRPTRLRSVKLGTLAVFTFSLRTEPLGADATQQRLIELETAMRNISWEVQALGYGHRFGQRTTSPITADGLRNLSKREREVLDAFLDGLSVSTSAASLHVSEHTVRSHLKAIYRKLGVRSQAELMLRMRGTS